MTRRSACLVLAAGVTLSGCGGPADPMDAPGTWSAHRDNDANLAAMIANPADMRRGEDAPAGRGATATAAIDRLLADKTRALLNADSFSTGGNGAAGQ